MTSTITDAALATIAEVEGLMGLPSGRPRVLSLTTLASKGVVWSAWQEEYLRQMRSEGVRFAEVELTTSFEGRTVKAYFHRYDRINAPWQGRRAIIKLPR